MNPPARQSLARMRRIVEKLRLKSTLAARVLLHHDDDFARNRVKVSFAQSGEDLIASAILHRLGISRPTFIDVGANHPTILNNTALFYAHGARGVNIEPDPRLFAAFARERPRDINLNIGISDRTGEMLFHRMADPRLSTFCAEEAENTAAQMRIAILDRVRLPVDTLANVMHTTACRPDFLTVDVEGQDLAVIRGHDFDRHRPAVICVETVGFVDGKKLPEVAEYLNSRDYRPYADTQINTIFVDRRRLP